MFAGLTFGGAPFGGTGGRPDSFLTGAAGIAVGAVAALTATAQLAGAATIAIGTVVAINTKPLAATAGITFHGRRADLRIPSRYGAGIAIGGIDATRRTRLAGVTIRDVLNDAPNTAALTVEGDAPAVGQRLRIAIGSPPLLLFAGTVQAVEQSYQATPTAPAWTIAAIDDTAIANARRPFGTWRDVSATTIALAIAAQCAPTFSTAGIAPNLPPVSLVCDGADTTIGALARLATAIGGYCKIEDATVYLFQTDYAAPPDPVDLAHPPLHDPAVQIHTDSSQLRTRVYGKGYGETLAGDVLADETLLPILNGVNFPQAGGTVIAGVTADGAQSERLPFSSVALAAGGTLVGPGAAPTGAPILAVAGGAGVDAGVRWVSVVFVTPTGKTLIGPWTPVQVGALAAPTAAPTVGAALTGTGPDQGSHDYAVSFVTSYGETIPGPISNSQTTSAAVGQLPEPAAPSGGSALQGSGVPNGQHQYRATFVNAAGETTVSNAGPPLTAETRLVGKTDPVVDQSWGGSTQGTTGGNVAPGPYAIYYTHVTAQGETNAVGSGIHCTLTAPNNAIQVPLPQHSDPRVTGHKLYRLFGSGSAAGAHLCATITHNNGGTYIDKAANETIQNNPTPPATNTTGNPGTPTPFNILQVTGVPIGPAGTTARRLYRGTGSGDAGKLVGTISNNSQTTFNDSLATPGAAAPTSNTTGTALQRLPLSNLPIGQAGVTARKLWRRFNGAGAFRLVTTIADNGTTDYTDAVGNSALGANAPATTTAVGNQIAASAIPIGPAPTTQRELYMQPLAGGAFRLALTIPNNTATTGTITVSDATLNGAPAAPAADTSGLTQPQGQVNPGATAIPLAAAATFRPSGGWVNIAGDQVVRYTGITGQSLTGIPATGPGAITTTVLYGSQALPAPMLVGVVGLTKALKKGAAIHLWIQRDDLAAQAEHAARTGGDGVVEYLITDTRRTIDSLTARCDADLALFSRPIVTVGYTTRDVKTKSGKPVRVTLPGFTVGEELTIQDVTITQIDVARGTAPRFAVQASNVRFSLEDTLRRLIAAENKGLR